MMETGNCVAKLNEYVQRTRSQLRYEDVGSVGPDHIKTFTVRVVLNGKAYPDGVGNNKKEAKQNAAKNVLTSLLEEPSSSTEKTAETCSSPAHPTGAINYVCWLNEYGHRTRLVIRPVESTKLGPNYTSQFVVGDKEYPAGYGNTKKEAKEEAAKLVYHEIFGCKTTETGGDSGTSGQQNEELQPNVSEISDKIKGLGVKTEVSLTETNFIGMVNHYCQKTKRAHDYILERRCGPPHSPQFFYKLVIDNKDYPVGEGKNVKEAKQNAAQLAWSALKEQSDWDSKITVFSGVSDDAGPARPTTVPNTPESGGAAASDSAVFTDPPNIHNMDKAQSPDVKPKIKLAANFQNAHKHSKEDIIDFNGKNAGRSLSEKTPTQSVTTRFTTEFDSIERLGKGAFGHVFKARQMLLDKFYAIKIVRCREKALREVSALSDLNHCNIVRYYTCWMDDSGYQWDSTADSSSSSHSTSNPSVKFLYIQMELCDFRTLRVWIDEKNTQSMKKSLRNTKRREESLAIALQLVTGVEYIHSKKLIHRDLKPANIMFGQDEVKIGDFGLVTAENDDAENLVERTVYKGTPSYMAPEQRNKSTYDKKVDIFALGLIYFELVWNLSGENKVIWSDARNQNLPQAMSQYFSHETDIIKSMLCENPENRPEASKVKADLEEWTQKLTDLKTMPCDSKTV